MDMKRKENPFRKTAPDAAPKQEVKLEWPRWARHYCERCKNFVVPDAAGGGDNFSPIIGGSVKSTVESFLISSALNSLTRSQPVPFCPICKSTNLRPRHAPRDPSANRPKNFVPTKKKLK